MADGVRQLAALPGVTIGAHTVNHLALPDQSSAQLFEVTDCQTNLRRVTATVTRRFYAGGWRRGLVGPRRCGRGRGVVAGAIFGGVLAVIEPAFAVLLGADPAAWSGTSVWLAGGVTALGCAIAGLAAASGRDTEA